MELQETLELFDRISNLNLDNWSVWKFKFEAALKQVGLWSLVVDDRIEIINGLDILDQKARTLIGLWVEDPLVPIIENCSTAHSMWKKLRNHFENANNDLMNRPAINHVTKNTHDKQKQCENPPEILKDETITHTKPIKTVVDPLINGINEPTTSVSSVRLISTIELDDDLTKPNLLINDISLHPKLRELNENFLLKVRKIIYDHSGSALFMATHDKCYYKLENRKLTAIKQITGQNIISLMVEAKIFLALTDRGDLYACNFAKGSIIKPELIMSNVKKICSFGDKMILKTDGTVLIYDDSNYPVMKAEYFKIDVRFLAYSIQDITSSVYGGITLTEDKKILLPDCWGGTPTFGAVLEHPDRENFISILGGFRSFILLGKNGKAYIYYLENSTKKILNQVIPSPEPFDACYGFKGIVDDYCFVSVSGTCYVWFGQKKKLIQSITRSIPDTINLYGKLSMSMMDVWSELPPSYALSKMLKEVEKFNNPKDYQFNLIIEGFEHKEIKLTYCDYLASHRINNPNVNTFVSSYPYSIYYQFFRYIQTGKTPITKEIIEEILKLFDEYHQNKKTCSAPKKSSHKKT